MKLLDKAIFLAVFGVLLFVGLNRHSHHHIFNYHAQLYTDKAGYQVYLPAFFYYDMDGSKMPQDIHVKTGTGFDIQGKKIITKYPVGVALFEMPFFALAALWDNYHGVTENLGYTLAQHITLNWAGAVYGTLALLVLFLTGTRFWNLSRSQAYLLIFMVLGCSNLLYYTTRDPGMSHLYSFTTFVCLQYLLFSAFRSKRLGWKPVVAILVLCSLQFTLRPINTLFIAFPLAYFFCIHREDVRAIVLKKGWLGFVVGMIIAALPVALQLVYNMYAYGSYFADSYANESFNRWNRLELHTFWLAPNNGVFLYIPILFIPMYWVWNKVKKGYYSSLLFLGYFLIISITYAAWWSPTLGCGFGHRGFTEHLAFFALPITQVLGTWRDKKLKVAWVIAIVVFLVLFISQYHFDDCWRGVSPWDWKEFWRLLKF
ncbi:hypothetical protein N8368_01880 [Bacteroidia bacterium]|nr:hypothetical protein [Bacteroidia bacterium]MDC1395239.1 hypothetical protein [Bacteroidia bacterium]